jgi:MipA family protein
MKRSLFCTAAVAAILSTAAAANAADQATPKTWDVTVGAGSVYAPRFDGAKKHRVVALPSFDIVSKDTIFVSTRDGVGANIVNNDLVKAGPVFKYNMGRRRADDRDALAGLDNVSGTVEGGGFFKYTPMPFLDASLEVRQGLGGHRGAIAELASNVLAPPLLSEKLFLSAGPRISFSDKNYNEAFYGVTAAEAARSGYARYAPKTGMRSYGLGAAARYELTGRIGLGLFAEYSRLTGPAADSPIVKGRDGSRTQSVFGTALTYSFN